MGRPIWKRFSIDASTWVNLAEAMQLEGSNAMIHDGVLGNYSNEPFDVALGDQAPPSLTLGNLIDAGEQVSFDWGSRYPLKTFWIRRPGTTDQNFQFIGYLIEPGEDK